MMYCKAAPGYAAIIFLPGGLPVFSGERMITISPTDTRSPAQESDMARYTALLREQNRQAVAATGRQPLAMVRTYGCQQNVSDSEKLEGMLEQMGYGFTSDPAQADVVLFNTCAVREHAEQRVFGNVGAFSHYKRKRPSMVIGLCGCMAQQEDVAEKIRKSYPYVDLVFGTFALPRLPKLLFEALQTGDRVFDTAEGEGIAEGLPVRRGEGAHAWLPVMYGCNNFCSYCIVPYVRGRERSRSPEAVLEEACGLIASGAKEITLLGQNVNSYGKDLAQKVDFAALLRALNDIEGEFRIRFMTSHPKDATPALFAAMAECEKVAKHLHLPFQSGSDRVLRRMNRGYTKEQYLSLVKSARTAMPGLSLSSDVIVGFPGETGDDFWQTLEVVKTVGFDNLYTFLYSRRPGTPAAEMPDDTPAEEKSARFQRLLDAQEVISARRMQSFVGQTLRVLCGGAAKAAGFYTGRADNNIVVDFAAEGDPTGRFVPVKITQAKNYMLVGAAELPAPAVCRAAKNFSENRKTGNDGNE